MTEAQGYVLLSAVFLAMAYWRTDRQDRPLVVAVLTFAGTFWAIAAAVSFL